MNTLFIMERFCDCNVACGTSGTDEYYLQTYRSLNIGPALVVNYDFNPVAVTVNGAKATAEQYPLDLVFYTEDGRTNCHVATYVGNGMVVSHGVPGGREIRDAVQFLRAE